MADLCDVNVLLALVVENHVFHKPASQWFEKKGEREVVVCRIAQLGFLRQLSHPVVMAGMPLTASQALRVWERTIEDGRFVVEWREPSGLDACFTQFVAGREPSRNLYTDAYLAAFAAAGGLTVVTFDKGFKSFKDLEPEVLSASS